MTVYFTSDLHLGHDRVASVRGFDRVEDHDEMITSLWDVVRDDDIVWVLGDLAMRADHALPVLAKLPGRKRLVLGNHDHAHPLNRNAHKWHRAYAEVFEFVAPFARLKVQGIEVLASHFPYDRDREAVRFPEFRLRDEGFPLLHGHTHGPERLTIDVRHPSRVEVHVGIDAWVRLVTDAEVAELLRIGGAA